MATNILAIVVVEAHAFVLRSPFPHFRISPFPISYFPVPGFSTTQGSLVPRLFGGGGKTAPKEPGYEAKPKVAVVRTLHTHVIMRCAADDLRPAG